eukprot:TRINITY_DN2393_c3_g1_i1.p1 TRINITY_DN2393_c3_g1~~TRINITY_DN2393_c3_g1_i1.p1  ORF type:complete len:993 (+),score=407.20 TRINITY_DN2393_c3_g1_i1:214-3192(+)
MSLEEDPLKVESILRSALKDAAVISGKLDEFESSRNQKLLNEVTNSLKGVMAQMRTVNPKGQKENVQLQVELKAKMKDLVDRTKNAAQTATSSNPSSSAASSSSAGLSSSYQEPSSVGRSRARASYIADTPQTSEENASDERIRSKNRSNKTPELPISIGVPSTTTTTTSRSSSSSANIPVPSSSTLSNQENSKSPSNGGESISNRMDSRSKAAMFLKSRGLTSKDPVSQSSINDSHSVKENSNNDNVLEGERLSPRLEEVKSSIQQTNNDRDQQPSEERSSSTSFSSENRRPSLGQQSPERERYDSSEPKQDSFIARNRIATPVEPPKGRISEPTEVKSTDSELESNHRNSDAGRTRSRLGSLRSGVSSLLGHHHQDESTQSSNSSSVTSESKPKLKGWLKKQGEDVFKGWKKRYFQIIESGEHANCLAYSNSEHEKPNGYIEINQFFHVAEIGNNQFDLDVGQRVYHLQASSREELKFWLEGLRTWHKSVMSEVAKDKELSENQIKYQKELFERKQQEERRKAEEERLNALKRAEEVQKKLEEKKRRDEEDAEVKKKLDEERSKLEVERQKEDEVVRQKMKQMEEDNRKQEQIQMQQKNRDNLLRAEQEERERQLEQENQRKHAETMANRLEEERLRLARAIEENEEKNREVNRAKLEEEKNSKKNLEGVRVVKEPNNSNALPVPTVNNTKEPSPVELSPKPSTRNPQSSQQQTSSAADKEKIRLLEERVRQLEKITSSDVNRELFYKLQEELNMKDRQYESLRSEHKANQQERRIAEEQRDSASKVIKELEEENKAKEHHIRRIQKKLKQARKEGFSESKTSDRLSMSPRSSSIGFMGGESLSAEIEQRDRAINKLKETIWAHQQQNAAITLELSRVTAENTAVLRAKDEIIERLEKEIVDSKEIHQTMREKYLEQQLGLMDPKDSSVIAEMQKLKKVYFFSLALNTKLNYAAESNVNVTDLYETVLGQDIDWKQWSDWIPNQIIKRSR